MTKLFRYIVAASIIAALATIFFIFTHLSNNSNITASEPYEVTQARTQATIAELTRQQHDAEFNQALGHAAVITVLIVIVALLAFVCWQISQAQTHRREMERARLEEEQHRLQPDQLGNYPQWFDSSRAIVIAPPPGNYAQNVPTHYAPHYAGAIASGRGPAVAELPAGPATAGTGSANVPSFAELFRRGDIGRDDSQMILGVSPAGELIKGSWLDLYSSGIAGVSGSGKTTTVRFLTAQAVMFGAKFIIVDPERDSEREDSLAVTLAPLVSRFLFNPACDDDEILAALRVADQELKARRSGASRSKEPLIIAVDELATLMRNREIKDQLSELLQNIAQGGRKHFIYALCMSQIWKGNTSGGTELRDSFASFYVHRLQAHQARRLVPADQAREVERFTTGQAYLSKTNGDLLPAYIPLTKAEDVLTIASAIADKTRQGLAEGKPEVSQKEVTFEANTPSADEMIIFNLFSQGKDIPEIVKELYGKQDGANLQRKNREVSAAIRRCMNRYQITQQ